MPLDRTEYLDLMTFRSTRPMFVELFGLLVGLDHEWRLQGASEDEIALTAFDWDFVPVTPCGGVTGVHGGPPTVVLEDNDEFRVERDELGRRMKLVKASATIPLPLDHPVTDMDSWLRIKPLFQFRESRIDHVAVEAARRAQQRGALVVASIPGAFDTPRQLMGEELTCIAYYEQPELMHDIVDTLRSTTLSVLERVTSQLVVDQVSVHEDLAGKPGPLVGPKQVREYFRPYFRAVWELASSRGTRLFDMDTDGNVMSILDDLLDCGLNSMHPMEPAAGMDIVTLRRRYGNRLAMRGGIDKHVLRQGQDEIRMELEYKLQPLMREGGIAFGLDHRIPNGTPVHNYRFYVDLGRSLLGIAPRNPACRGWQRMAF